MSRPGPNIIDSHTNAKWQTTAIIEPKTTYVVCRDGKPIALRWHDDLKQITAYKYRRSTFPTSGHAIALASRLNSLFKTDRFTVHTMLVGPPI